MTTPVRLQLSRRKGFDLQALSQATNGLPAVKVDRSTPWGNPWTIADPHIPGTAEAVRLFRCAVIGFNANGSFCKPIAHPGSYVGRIISGAPRALRGKNLACWCKPGAPCHADVLLELANRPACEAVD